jgi:hypothetical protein
MYVQISPPGAQSLRQQGGWDWLSRPSVLSPTNDIEISDARVHEEGAGGRQYVVFVCVNLQDKSKERMKNTELERLAQRRLLRMIAIAGHQRTATRKSLSISNKRR